jgi:F0F1-type ATP synthase gamma subunit
MTNKTLPILTLDEINKAKDDSWDFLFLFIDQYYKIMSSDQNEEIMEEFSADQHTLLAFNSLYGQVTNGGFLQLIQNGYGSYVFENPFSEHIKSWGAIEIANIVDEAKIIYEKHKTEIEKEATLEEFSKMYEEYTDFEPLDDKFYEIMDGEVEIIRKYVENNLSLFAIVTE